MLVIASLTGTNINEALLRATFILNEAKNLGMLDPNSVSMIVFVSDGDPTVGKALTLGDFSGSSPRHTGNTGMLYR